MKIAMKETVYLEADNHLGDEDQCRVGTSLYYLITNI